MLSTLFHFLPLLQVSQEVQATGSFYSTIGTALLVLLLVSLAAILISLSHIWNSGNPAGWRFKWTAVVVIFGLIGCIAYFFIGRKEAKKPTGEGDEGEEEKGEETEEKEEAKSTSKAQAKNPIYPA